MGVPFKSEDGTHSEWLPPAEFYAIRAGQGPSILILEELSDASMAMQNPLCRVILDRYAGQLKLSEQLFIIATGNRVEDKSGANRLSTKLGNRVRTLEFESNVDDWMKWAYEHGINSLLTSFIKFRPALLNSFDPKVAVNPTPRSWEDVNRVPVELDATTFFEHVKGAVGEAAATEYTSFIRMAKEMPDPNEVIKNPERAPIPDKPNVLYAYLGAVECLVNKKNASKMIKYAMRLSPEMQTILIVGCFIRCKDIIHAEGFIGWAKENSDLMATL